MLLWVVAIFLTRCSHLPPGATHIRGTSRRLRRCHRRYHQSRGPSSIIRTCTTLAHQGACTQMPHSCSIRMYNCHVSCRQLEKQRREGQLEVERYKALSHPNDIASLSDGVGLLPLPGVREFPTGTLGVLPVAGRLKGWRPRALLEERDRQHQSRHRHHRLRQHLPHGSPLSGPLGRAPLEWRGQVGVCLGAGCLAVVHRTGQG